MARENWLRRSRFTLGAIALVVLWLVLGAIGGPTFGKLDSVSSNDESTFLPSSAESTQVRQAQKQFQATTAIPAIIVFEKSTPFSATDVKEILTLKNTLAKTPGLVAAGSQPAVIGPIVSDDRKAVQLIAEVKNYRASEDVVPELRDKLQNLPAGWNAYVAGPAGIAADFSKAFGGIDSILLAVALGVVFVILLAVYRSVLLPVIVLLNSMLALCAAVLVVYYLARWGLIQLNGQSQGILSILVIGAATDYSLLLVSRYREALRHIEAKRTAIWRAFRVSFEPILASASTVALALLCLLLSDLNSNRSLGPVAATGIVFAFLSTVTFLPAILYLFGRTSFWPMRPKYAGPVTVDNEYSDISRLWRWVGRLVSRRARTVWVISLLLLLAGSAGLFGLRASGIPQEDVILSQSDAVDGQHVIDRHFRTNMASPLVIITPESTYPHVLQALADTPEVSRAVVYAERPGIDPKVVGGNVMMYAYPKAVSPGSEEAQQAVRDLRTRLDAVTPHALVGGTTAISMDITTTAQSDLRKLIPVVLGVILVVLILLLRALVVPVLLIASVAVSYAAALGISSLVFNEVFKFPGADPAVPLFAFVFLVALGVDYNIFLMTRIREEAFVRGTRPAIVYGLGKTGGVITSAGIVLAATFAALGVIPILFLAEIAFIVAFGVLLDTIVVRSLLVPALSYDIGRPIWWPSRLWRTQEHAQGAAPSTTIEL